MIDTIDMTIRMPKVLATTVRNFLALMPSVEIIGETSCTKPKKELGTDVIPKGTNGNGNEEDENPITQFIEKCKEVAQKIGELNGEEITFSPKGKEIKYTLHFDAKGCCELLDNLIGDDECFSYIEDYLHGSQKPTGISIVLPFMGKILNERLFCREQNLHKASLTEKLKEIYPEGSIINYLSFDGRNRRKELKQLYLRTVEIAIEKGLTSLN